MFRHPLSPAPGALLLLLVCLLAVPPALADAPVRPLVIDLTTGAKTPREAAIGAYIAKETPLQPGTYPLISGADPLFMETFRWAHPNGPDLKCPYPTRDLQEQFAQASELIVALELEKAIELLEAAYDTIPCQLKPVSREALWKLFYLEGIARTYAGDREGSDRAFLEALAVNPVLVRLPGFPPDVTDAYLNAAKKLTTLQPVRLAIDPGQRKAFLRIDGQPLPDTPELAIQPGRHMAQVFDDFGLARSAVLRIDPGETRPLSALVDLLPNANARVLKELLVTAVRQRELSNAQARALTTICAVQGYPAIMFVVIKPELNAERLVTFIPGKGLIDGAPPGLAPLPPLEADESSGFADKRPKKGATVEGSAPQPAGPRPFQHALRLSLGALRYDKVNFADLRPSWSFRIVQGLFTQTTLYFSNDFGTSADEPRSILGLRLGLEYEWSIQQFQPRLGLGYGVAAGRLVLEGERIELVIEATPELWLGVDYKLSDLPLRVGLEGARGFTPGLVGDSRGLWRGALSVAWQLP